MITLYVIPKCPFCLSVLKKINELSVEAEVKDISEVKHLCELIKMGGKKQVPFLLDIGRNVFMYESLDIIDYLNKCFSISSNVKE